MLAGNPSAPQSGIASAKQALIAALSAGRPKRLGLQGQAGGGNFQPLPHGAVDVGAGNGSPPAPGYPTINPGGLPINLTHNPVGIPDLPSQLSHDNTLNNLHPQVQKMFAVHAAQALAQQMAKQAQYTLRNRRGY